MSTIATVQTCGFFSVSSNESDFFFEGLKAYISRVKFRTNIKSTCVRIPSRNFKKMKFTLALLVVAAVFGCVLSCIPADFDIYKSEYNKVYESPEEEAKRLDIWCANIDKINAHNQLYKDGKSTFTQGQNAMTDLTYEEFSKRLGLSMGGRPLPGLAGLARN
ncbi:protein CTLA-2-alpha-like [Episyrphus balteatus]|uniref:protein CTLA-2-alpha-like n=1 Tax=Episyrphus balteatus TaxID=286459 RepID=UPI0024856FCB|nr:protein CTLA-2-alpha-like [Episyrphus balteatus]